MERYIALLRGINVGGNNLVSMTRLKVAFEEAGFRDVTTYINSGNVLFTSDEEDVLTVQKACRKCLQEKLDLDVPIGVYRGREIRDALEHAPAWWGSDEGTKHTAIFVIPPADAAALVGEVGLREEYEQVGFHGPVIFWSAPLATFSRTRWSKVVSTSAYRQVTIRNANTARKLASLAAQTEERK